VTTISRHLSRLLPFTVVKVRKLVFTPFYANNQREYFKLCFFRLSQLELNIKPTSTLMTETFASTGKKDS